MKAITMRIQKFSRPGVMLMATVVVIITSMVVANATQTITTPNAAFISYNLAGGANSAAITPVASRPVLVMGCSTTANYEGVGQVTLIHNPGTYFDWAGVESGGNAFAGGVSGIAGVHIVYIDNVHKVDVQVASRDTILVHNGNSLTVTGRVTPIW